MGAFARLNEPHYEGTCKRGQRLILFRTRFTDTLLYLLLAAASPTTVIVQTM